MSEESRKETGNPTAAESANSEGASGTRRDIIKAGLTAVPVLLTLKSRPAWAKKKPKDGTDNYTDSDRLSGTHFSHQPNDRFEN